ncbi:PREDICTED: ATP-dependent DNA helicase Q-like 5 isoform X2 [Nelumbo nucifera]|uniref:DNA 3'-5' helicase n=1 Tax=Nelumbo nucifera TaxID=4432 RepID=A0A1U7Z8T8_NELNU|nr:PREDICTED: ATP-dependent DNA helicase Q-like 5 isoform X2 [Nelumbo nucifera]
MESDSDSDGSHISATPPRGDPKASQAHHLSPLKKSTINRHGISSCTNSISRQKPVSSRQKPLKTKAKTKTKAETKTKEPDDDPPPRVFPSADFSTLPGVPIQIRRPSDRDLGPSASNSTETLRQGHFANWATFSFSKVRRVNIETTEEDEVQPSLSISRPETGNNGDRNERGESSAEAVPLDINNESAHLSNSTKPLRKHPNSIGGNVPLPLKRRKCGGEGNFVRLNINGRGRKFTSKGGKRRISNYSTNRRYCSRSKRKPRKEGEAEVDGLYDEGGLVSETLRQKQEQCKHGRFSYELIEQAVSDARDEPSDENLRKLLKLTHGYDSFREGQLEAIKQVIAGQSTMLVLPTGAGKSLCYQLPALILPGLTLVVSPLVALMVDQLKQLPSMVQGALLCSSQSSEVTSETLQQLREGRIKVLFVSPERFLNAEFVSIFGTTLLVSLVVVDEAHCISEWSHNFRPSYLRLRASLLQAKLSVKCILAMTATATCKTLHAVMSALEIPPTSLIQTSQIRENLQLSITLSGNRMKDLMMLIKSALLAEVRSIIIYCKFQSETDLLSKHLCDNNIFAKSYHSGISAKERIRTQEMFCSNKIRVVVATVAFGMGLDKGDVGAVIHYSLPESVEEYVQEIGRAGRDGRLSYCHLLFDETTYFKLRSLLYSDGVDEYAVNRFLSQVFSSNMGSTGKVCSLVKESASRKFDMKEEVMLTLLTYLELGEVQYLNLLPQLNVTCTLYFHKTSPDLLAVKDILVAAILKKSETKQGYYIFDMPTVANSTGMTIANLSNHLQKLKVRKLDAMFNAATFASKLCPKMDGCSGSLHTACLQRRIFYYFSKDDDRSSNIANNMGHGSPFLRADIKVFLQSSSHEKFTPRAVARIMHGIASPAYPSTTWSRTHFWGRYMHIDFPAVMEAAKMELMNFVGKDVL